MLCSASNEYVWAKIIKKKTSHTLSPVGASPKVTNDFVDFFHLHAMKCHYCSKEEEQKL